MIEWLLASGPALVASSEFQTTSVWSVMRFSQNGALRLDLARPFHIWLRAFMSPATTT